MKKYYFNKLTKDQIAILIRRPAIDFCKVMPVVKCIIDDVKKYGDDSVKKYTKKFDGINIDNFKTTNEDIEKACKKIPEDLKKAVAQAFSNIYAFQNSQFIKKIPEISTMPGIKCSTQIRPIKKVGIYIPGGTAVLPSTLLMLSIPAKIAGVSEIVMCTPPNKEGKISDIVLYVAKICGITKIFKIGGAQAIAAMAYGTKTISKVDKIFGPGNQYVTAAKMLISIDSDGCPIDLPAGPSEVFVVADDNANASFVAADLLSQAEHGTDSQAIFAVTSEQKADEILKEIDEQLNRLPRKDITKIALEKSFVLIVKTIEEGIEFANLYAPEHLILNVKNAEDYAAQVQNAGSVFLGQYSCEAAGDYASGPNHTLPTYGYAKAYSGVSVDTFVKKITFQKLSYEGVKNIGGTVERLAECEGLDAHKNAMQLRLKYN